MEDSLILDGHVPRLAKVMKWPEREAGGALWMLYRATQAAGIISDKIDRVITVSILAFDDDDQARQFVFAMASARLAEIKGDEVRIFGNEKHVQRFAENRDRNVKGGKARAAQLREKHEEFREPQASLTLATGKPQASTPNSPLPSPVSPVPDLFPQHRDLASTDSLQVTPNPQTAIAAATTAKRTAAQVARSKALRTRYVELYEASEGHPPSEMDRSTNAALARWCDAQGDNAFAVLDWFFKSPDGFYKRSGWPVPLMIAQTPKLWRECNDPNKARENLAAPVQQRMQARNASLDIELERANQILRDKGIL